MKRERNENNSTDDTKVGSSLKARKAEQLSVFRESALQELADMKKRIDARRKQAGTDSQHAVAEYSSTIPPLKIR